MTTPYLIAHLVRGQPAFDIAEQIEVEGEVWWIIPTSGHRAYPYWSKGLDEVLAGPGSEWLVDPWENIPDPPEGHPDHYATSAAPRGQGLIKNLAERLGFVPAPPKVTRR